MSTVTIDGETGQVLSVEDKPAPPPMSVDEAQAITAKIKGYSVALWLLIEEAHDRKAWEALGYSSWERYLSAEFDISRAHGYRLVAQASIVRELEAAAGFTPSTIDEVSPMGDIPERTTRDLAKHMDEVAEEIADRVAGLPDPTDEAKADIVTEVVTETLKRERTTTTPSAGEGTPVPSDAPSPPASVDAPPSPAEPPTLDMDETALEFRELGKRLDKAMHLFDLDPERVGFLVPASEREHWQRVAVRIHDWSLGVSAALAPQLRSVK